MTKTDRFPEYVFKPQKSLGPITFAMHKDAVRDQMSPYRHKPSRLFKLRGKRKPLKGDAFHTSCLHVLYDTNDQAFLIVAGGLSVRKGSARGIDVQFNRPNRVIKSLAKNGWVHQTSSFVREMNADDSFDAKRPAICIVPDLAIGFYYADFDDDVFQTMFMGMTRHSLDSIVAFYTRYT